MISIILEDDFVNCSTRPYYYYKNHCTKTRGEGNKGKTLPTSTCSSINNMQHSSTLILKQMINDTVATANTSQYCCIIRTIRRSERSQYFLDLLRNVLLPRRSKHRCWLMILTLLLNSHNIILSLNSPFQIPPFINGFRKTVTLIFLITDI